jgi:hypothetical protein
MCAAGMISYLKREASMGKDKLEIEGIKEAERQLRKTDRPSDPVLIGTEKQIAIWKEMKHKGVLIRVRDELRDANDFEPNWMDALKELDAFIEGVPEDLEHWIKKYHGPDEFVKVNEILDAACMLSQAIQEDE